MAKDKTPTDSGPDEPEAAPAPAPQLSLTVEMLKEIISAAVTAAVTAISNQPGNRRRLVGKDLTDRVKAIKAKTGDHARPALPDLPPAGHALIANQFGRGVKLVELYMVLSPETVVLPFGDRFVAKHAGHFFEDFKLGRRKLKAFTPYPGNLVRHVKTGEVVDLASALPAVGGEGGSIEQLFEQVAGSWCEHDYAQAVKSRLAAAAA